MVQLCTKDMAKQKQTRDPLNQKFKHFRDGVTIILTFNKNKLHMTKLNHIEGTLGTKHGKINLVPRLGIMDSGVEASFPISEILHGSDVAIFFDQRIFSPNFIPRPFLLLSFDVASMLIIHGIFKFVVSIMVLLVFAGFMVNFFRMFVVPF